MDNIVRHNLAFHPKNRYCYLGAAYFYALPHTYGMWIYLDFYNIKYGFGKNQYFEYFFTL